MLIWNQREAEIFGMLLRSYELYVYYLPCQVLMYTCISVTCKQNKRRMCSSFLWFTFVEMLCTICKCFWLSIFLYVQKYQVPMCVLNIYLNLLFKRSPCESSKTLNVYIQRCECEDQCIFSPISMYMYF